MCLWGAWCSVAGVSASLALPYVLAVSKLVGKFCVIDLSGFFQLICLTFTLTPDLPENLSACMVTSMTYFLPYLWTPAVVQGCMLLPEHEFNAPDKVSCS